MYQIDIYCILYICKYWNGRHDTVLKKVPVLKYVQVNNFLFHFNKGEKRNWQPEWKLKLSQGQVTSNFSLKQTNPHTRAPRKESLAHEQRLLGLFLGWNVLVEIVLRKTNLRNLWEKVN